MVSGWLTGSIKDHGDEKVRAALVRRRLRAGCDVGEQKEGGRDGRRHRLRQR